MDVPSSDVRFIHGGQTYPLLNALWEERALVI